MYVSGEDSSDEEDGSFDEDDAVSDEQDGGSEVEDEDTPMKVAVDAKLPTGGSSERDKVLMHVKSSSVQTKPGTYQPLLV
ncbi:hypothetical protein FRX31_018974 [Thalictrum thalictroides]|uniref:Uncharacterized protein n=1 Tax=Thalictrum thalictroides TaxID=46969 RepID=A0A7J6W235_THATH|nr:hypothetical protein FRX31_018974 [Thalictrum thalictroides]